MQLKYAVNLEFWTRKVNRMTEKQVVQQDLLTAKEFAQALGNRLSIRSVYKNLAANNIKHFRTNTRQGRYAIPASEVEAYPRRQIEKFS